MRRMLRILLSRSLIFVNNERDGAGEGVLGAVAVAVAVAVVVAVNQQNHDNANNNNTTRKRPRRSHMTGTNGDKVKATTFVRRSNRGGKPLCNRNHSCSNESEARIVENALQLSKFEADERERSENIKNMKLSASTSISSTLSSSSTKRRLPMALSINEVESGGSLEKSNTKISRSLSPPNNKKSITNRFKKNAVIESTSNEIEEVENEEFFCKILWKMSETIVVRNRVAPSTIDDAKVNVGFIALPCKKKSTFADVRKVMMRDLDEDCIPRDTKWKFYIPNLGPMSMKQEVVFGPVLIFLQKSTINEQLGDGSSRNPLKIIIFECD